MIREINSLKFELLELCTRVFWAGLILIGLLGDFDSAKKPQSMIKACQADAIQNNVDWRALAPLCMGGKGMEYRWELLSTCSGGEYSMLEPDCY